MTTLPACSFQLKLPGAVVGNTCGTVRSYSFGVTQLSKKKYRS